MVLAFDHFAKARKVAFHLVRADAVEAVRLTVIDAERREQSVQVIPVRGFIGMNFRRAMHIAAHDANALALKAL